MLFDLRGRRRRAVQATYLILALLMGGGLVLFGIGGSVSGGLVDAFKGNSGGSGNDLVEERIERNEDRVQASPANVAALKELVRDNYQLATADLPSATERSRTTQGTSSARPPRTGSATWRRRRASPTPRWPRSRSGSTARTRSTSRRTPPRR